MEWAFRKESIDEFWRRLEAETAGDAAGRSTFPLLSRPLVHVSLLVALALAYCIASLPVKKTLEGDEALYALIPKTIATTGEWIHLSYNGEPYYFKPPLNFWITAALFHVLPMNSFTAALGSGLFGALSALLIYVMCRVMFPGWQLAFSSTLVYLTTHEVLHWTRGVHLETVLTFWILVGLLAAYYSIKSPAAVAGLGVAGALGWLAKGPQALYPAGVTLLLWKSEGILWRRLLSVWNVAAAVLLLGILAPWFWARLHAESGFGQGYFVKEISRTLFGPTQLHNGPLFYPVKLAQSYWPWLPAAAFGFVLLGKSWRRSLGARVWLLFAAVLTFIILITAERRMRYLFQLYPALSVASGAAVTFAVQRYPRLLRIFVGLVAAAAIGLVIFGGKSRRASPPTRDALMVAARLQPGDDVWLTDRSERGTGKLPGVSKSLGYYARPLLRTCKQQCAEEASPGSIIIARADEAERVAGLVRGRIDYSNKTLAIVKKPAAAARESREPIDAQSGPQVK